MQNLNIVYNNLQNICSYYSLGELVEAIPVTGGLLHKIYRCLTAKGIFAIKELSAKIDLTNQQIIDNYNLTENIATSFRENDIPAIAAIAVAGKYLYIINNKGYLVYPWVEARQISEDEVAELHGLKIAETLAKIHHANLTVSGLSDPVIESDKSSKIRDLADQAVHLNISADQINMLLRLNQRFHETHTHLENNYVISHCDLDPKNVLWDVHDNPVLIDWESAGAVNSSYDIINTALYWSGITTIFNVDMFRKMLQIYKQSGGAVDEASYLPALYASAGNWINWLIYNIERSLSQDAEQSKIGAEQVVKTLHTIENIDMFIKLPNCES